MTTIAYSSGVIAYDSRCCGAGTIYDDNFNKHRKHGRIHFFFTGSTCDIAALIAMYVGEKAKPVDACVALVWDGYIHELLSVGWNGQKYYTNEEDLDRCCAFGSGSSHALTAMDCGLSAKDAVKMATKRDSNSGGRIRTYEIPARRK